MSFKGFRIGDKHTYEDWGLKCYDYKITFPESQKSLLQIPGRNGKINVAQSAQKEAYEHRQIKIYCDAPDRDYESWTNLVSDIANYVQDEYLSIIPDFDPEYYYRGWVSIEPSKDFKVGSDIIFTVDAEPFKLKKDITEAFVAVSGETTVVLSNAKKVVQPEIVTDSENMLITVGENTFSYTAAGTYAKAGFFLFSGETELKISGDGGMVIRYQEAKL